jgi:integrase
MSRAAKPPHLAPFKRKGRAAVWAIVWTEPGRGGQRAETGYAVAAPDGLANAERFFEAWQEKRRAATQAPAGASDPTAVKITDVIDAYIIGKRPPGYQRLRGEEHAMELAAHTRKVLNARPLSYFFADDTISALTRKRQREYREWRQGHSVRVVDKKAGTVEIIEAETSDGTMRREIVGLLRPAITFAIEEGMLPTGLVVPLELPPVPEARDRWLSETEVAKLLWEARGAVLTPEIRRMYGHTSMRDRRPRSHLPLFIRIALYTAARRGAILNLKWPQIDLVNETIDFREPGRQTTKKGRNVVPIPRQLMVALRIAQRYATCEYVIADADGRRVLDVHKGFDAAVKRAGIARCSIHTLRHTAATWLAQRGVEIWDISKQLGHADVRTTNKVYAHHSPKHLAKAKAGFERRRAG